MVYFVPYHHDLATARIHIAVHNATEFRSQETGAVDDDVGIARRVEAPSFGDVREDTSLEYHAVLEALADKPRKVYGGVDAD